MTSELPTNHPEFGPSPRTLRPRRVTRAIPARMDAGHPSQIGQHQKDEARPNGQERAVFAAEAL